MGRNMLIVSTAEPADEFLRSHIGDADAVKVVVPVVRQGVLDWLANDEKAFVRAARVAARTAEELPGETAKPWRVRRTWVSQYATRSRPSLPMRSSSSFVRANRSASSSRSRQRARRSTVEGVPVRYLVIPEA
jgi:hypothetical protein